VAFRWRSSGRKGGAHGAGWLQPVRHVHRIRLADLRGIDKQIRRVEQNTRQFLEGKPANNVLLTGARGTGKSSLVKALLSKFSKHGLRIVEVDKQDLTDLPQITALLRAREERFIVFCDDLSFESGEPGYKALKVVLDGSVATTSDNILVYATSNRRHLMPEYMAENLETKYQGDEIRPAEAVEEKVSLSDRFGIWLSFYPFAQDEYLVIAEQWLKHYGIKGFDDQTRGAALQWALTRGSRSGRSAHQFARDFAGRAALAAKK
jgi:predicted AAA+ superfamily ATPase